MQKSLHKTTNKVPSLYRNHIIISGCIGFLLIIAQLWILVIPVLLMQRYLVFSFTNIQISFESLDLIKIHKSLEEERLNLRWCIKIFNEVIFFPLFIWVYSLVLLLTYTRFGDIYLQTRFLAIPQPLLYILIIMSWIIKLVFPSDQHNYLKRTNSLWFKLLVLLLILGISILSNYLLFVYTKALGLGLLWSTVSGLFGIILFLFGIYFIQKNNT